MDTDRAYRMVEMRGSRVRRPKSGEMPPLFTAPPVVPRRPDPAASRWIRRSSRGASWPPLVTTRSPTQ
jgi:hypothetical protein